MNLRITLYETLVNNKLLIRVQDLDNEGKIGQVEVTIKGVAQTLEFNVDHISVSPLDVFVQDTPLTRKINEVTAKIYTVQGHQLHDTDTKLIKLGK
jgi:hypothetical protein